MSDSGKLTIEEIEELLEELLVDAYCDDEQLTALHEGVEDAVELPIDVLITGQPMSLVGIDYDGNARRGLMAQCLSDDGRKHRINFADVQIPPDTIAYRYLAAYCRWLGIEPVALSHVQGASGLSDQIDDDDDDIDVTKPVELVVLVVKERAARCRRSGSNRIITLKAPESWSTAPGSIVLVEPSKYWHFKGHPYLSGRIVSSRADAEALGLQSLAVNSVGVWDPVKIYGADGRMDDMRLSDETEADGDASANAWLDGVMERGPRPMYEMQQVLPGFDSDDPDGWESDPIIQVNELRERQDFEAARQLLSDLLEADLRCIDAHAHLGSMAFERFSQQAHDHYNVGVKIGEKALGADFDGVLPWRYLDNRPFLRCLHGLGLSLWKLGRWNEAQQVFERILELSPMDELGVLSMLPDVKAHQPYADVQADAESG